MDFEIRSEKWQESIDITEGVQKAIDNLWEKERKLICNKKARVALVYCPHTTGGITVNEGSDNNVMLDVLDAIDEITPRLDFRHKEGNSMSHIKASLVGSSVMIPLEIKGDKWEKVKLGLGTWQKIFFMEFDGPRKRKIIISIF